MRCEYHLQLDEAIEALEDLTVLDLEFEVAQARMQVLAQVVEQRCSPLVYGHPCPGDTDH